MGWSSKGSSCAPARTAESHPGRRWHVTIPRGKNGKAKRTQPGQGLSDHCNVTWQSRQGRKSCTRGSYGSWYLYCWNLQILQQRKVMKCGHMDFSRQSKNGGGRNGSRIHIFLALDGTSRNKWNWTCVLSWRSSWSRGLNPSKWPTQQGSEYCQAKSTEKKHLKNQQIRRSCTPFSGSNLLTCSRLQPGNPIGRPGPPSPCRNSWHWLIGQWWAWNLTRISRSPNHNYIHHINHCSMSTYLACVCLCYIMYTYYVYYHTVHIIFAVVQTIVALRSGVL